MVNLQFCSDEFGLFFTDANGKKQITGETFNDENSLKYYFLLGRLFALSLVKATTLNLDFGYEFNAKLTQTSPKLAKLWRELQEPDNNRNIVEELDEFYNWLGDEKRKTNEHCPFKGSNFAVNIKDDGNTFILKQTQDGEFAEAKKGKDGLDVSSVEEFSNLFSEFLLNHRMYLGGVQCLNFFYITNCS